MKHICKNCKNCKKESENSYYCNHFKTKVCSIWGCGDWKQKTKEITLQP